MEKAKQIVIKILFPHIAVIVLLVPVSIVMLIYSFGNEAPIPVVEYASYCLSAYSLTILCVRMPFIYRKVKRFRQENKYAALYFSDASLRVKISLYSTLVINVLYGVLQLSMGSLNHSVWFYALSGYYFMLAFMRFFLLRETCMEKSGVNMPREYHRYRLCGVGLLFMNIILSVIVFYIVQQNRGFTYHYIMTIAMAAYTFFTFTVAVINMIKYRKYNSPVMSAAKQISFVSGLVSMMSLETAMLAAFGEDSSPMFGRIMNAATGTAVCTTILIMAIYMIVHSTKQLRQGENIK